MISTRKRIGAALGLAVALSGIVAAPSTANPAGTALVISEVYGAGGNSGANFNADFVELYNPTNAAISLAGRGLQYRSASGGSGGVAALSGSVPANSTFLIRVAPTGANGAALPTPDLVTSTTLNMSGSNGQVLLLPNTSAFSGSGNVAGNAGVIDMVGFGTGISTFEGAQTGVALTPTTSAQRNATGADTDHNANDFSEAIPTPTPATSVGTTLTATDPADLNAVVSTAITPFDLAATGGTPPYSWNVAGLPAGVTATVAGLVSGTPTATGTFDATATVTDSTSPTPATSAVTFTITVTETPEEISIAQIQGTGDASGMQGDTVTTEGVVTAKYPGGASTYNGIYIQTAGSGGVTNATPNASDAIFVFGNNSQPAGVEIGDSVSVTGVVSEFSGLTEITPGSGGVVEIASLGTVSPRATVPGTDCALPGTACLTGAALSSAREAFEGELFQPTGDYTVTDVYDGSAYTGGSSSSNFFGEIGLAAESDLPLITPTEVIDAQATADISARNAYNDAHRMILDDGAAVTYWNTSNSAQMDQPFPWFTTTNHVRVGASVTFPEPVVMEWRNSTWKLQPQSRVTDSGADRVAFEQDRPAEPEDVGGDLKLATFNVLNYFTTLGEDFGGCSSYKDRLNNPIAVNQCPGDGPRGAWNDASFDRQQTKIVNAINAIDADIVSVEEIENSLKVDGHDRDEAIAALVDALNADAGAGTWNYVESPASASDPSNLAGQDVIRTGFIYQPATVETVGAADMLFGSAAFANAREPFAQAFKAVGSDDADGFAVIGNHFKSKGSGVDDGTGQGNANPDRIAQAEALSAYADVFAGARGVEAVFLTGDFNASSQEDPMQVLYGDGYEKLAPENKWSYSFNGQVQSLDHVLANAAASELVTGSDLWEINANETVFTQYSRYNYNATILYDESPYSSSDHNPAVVGIDVSGAEPTTKTIQVLATNDFHGRLQNNTSNTEAGAAVLSGAVKQLRQENPDTVFAAAGDLIGASTFESFIQNDKPTIDALNEAGLEVSAVGNHEFDQGYDDLINRVMADYDATTNPEGGADWQYIGANVRLRATGDPAVPASWIKDFDGVEVGFVGAVTEDLPSLVSPAGIADIEVTDIVDSVNAEADELEGAGVDVIVVLVHEGAATTNVASATNDSNFGEIVNGVNENIDAIVSGHTHLAYNHAITVPEWVTEGRTVTTRPVVSAGQYGTNLNQLEFTVDTTTGDVEGVEQNLLALKSNATTFNYPADPAVASIVSSAVTAADTLGAAELGEIGGVFNRAKLSNGTENRGGESTLGNLVAEVQQWATEDEVFGAAEIAFMNPGGLRADMAGTGSGAFPRVLTFKQAANVQPFANTLVNMQLTGADIKVALEQQWQRDGAGNIPSRPFLRLGVSEGFEYTYDPALPEGDRIKGMWLNGEPIDPATAYSVTVNSFLASGGDNFRAFNNGTEKRDTGQIDLQAMVDYMDEFGSTTPLAVDYSQRAVGVSFPGGAPNEYLPGGTVAFDLSSLAMSTADDTKDNQVVVSLDGTDLGSFPVDNAVGTAVFDEVGTASVSVALPNNAPNGAQTLVVTGAATGTEILVPINVGSLGSVSGVVQGQAAAPVAGACVYLYTSQAAASASYASCTQADGSYFVPGVSPGSYEVAVADPSGTYATTWLEDPITVDGAETGVDVTLSAVANGAMTGTVTASSGPSAGGPVPNVCVFAYEEDVTTQAAFASCANGAGQYGIYGIAGGNYDVAFFDPAGVYPTQWSTGTAGGAPSQSGAVAVTVPGSGSVTVDAVLSSVSTGAVTGTVTNAGGSPVGGVCVYLYTNPAGPAEYGTCTQADGTFYLGNVVAGSSYRVGFADPAGLLATQWWTGNNGGAPAYAGGSNVTVTAGTTTNNINAQMAATP